MPAGRDGFIPPFMDLTTLAAHICCSKRSILTWVELGTFPAPVTKLGDKPIWSWEQVENHLANNGLPGQDDLGARVEQGTRRLLSQGRPPRKRSHKCQEEEGQPGREPPGQVRSLPSSKPT